MNRLREIHLSGKAFRNAQVRRTPRLPKMVDAPADAGPALRRQKVLVVGLGSVGLPAALDLSRLGVHTLALVDPGRFKDESVATHPILPADVHKSKAAYAGFKCKLVSPDTRVLVAHAPLQDLLPVDLLGFDLCLVATDNLHAEVAAGELCMKLGLFMIHAAVYGPAMTAQVRCFGNRDGHGPCPACAYSSTEWKDHDAEATFSCSGAPAPAAPPGRRPTMSFSALCSLAANVAVIQAVRRMVGAGKPMDDTLVQYNLLNHDSSRSPLTRNPACRIKHVGCRPVEMGRPLTRVSPEDLLRLIPGGRSAALHHYTIRVDNLSFVDEAACPGCGWTGSVNRFCATNPLSQYCTGCGRRLVTGPVNTFAAVPAKTLGALIKEPFSVLCPVRFRSVTISNDQTSWLFHIKEATHAA
jgi:molybdopterin/thiamine biosynthesis adenylyltransferase